MLRVRQGPAGQSAADKPNESAGHDRGSNASADPDTSTRVQMRTLEQTAKNGSVARGAKAVVANVLRLPRKAAKRSTARG